MQCVICSILQNYDVYGYMHKYIYVDIHIYIYYIERDILRIIHNVWSREDQEPFISKDHLSHQTLLDTAAGRRES